MAMIEVTKRKRARVKNELYPLLLEASKSVEDAKIFCTAGALAIEQAFANIQKTMLVKNLELSDKLRPDADRYEYFKKLMDMFQEETIADALSMVRDMPHAIDSFIREEMTKRELSTLKAELLD